MLDGDSGTRPKASPSYETHYSEDRDDDSPEFGYSDLRHRELAFQYKIGFPCLLLIYHWIAVLWD